MKILQRSLRNFAVLGIDSDQNPFNARILMTIIFYLLTNGSIFIYIFYKANDIREYTLAIFTIFITITITIVFIAIVIEMKKMFELIDFCEEIIKKSKTLQSFLAMINLKKKIKISLQDQNIWTR